MNRVVSCEQLSYSVTATVPMLVLLEGRRSWGAGGYPRSTRGRMLAAAGSMSGRLPQRVAWYSLLPWRVCGL
eukprot:CAMPEP_0204252636 /NCGR_PEP_ID=MMETSP0468-20130131/1327_1 /ASSEMBLY_ACC=CAM_ASM_000383 /TAXON_ID=2969 /ORGANISM="Oxyrrhis marina" /LENGTH=71 /DNA_ID=CAMNT_0051226089 /DNA_START=77 /DNA_END=292 /DNA_ORIENTATION=-